MDKMDKKTVRAATFIPSKWEEVDDSEAAVSSKWDDVEKDCQDLDISSSRCLEMSSERGQGDSPDGDNASLDDR